jgi:hypothetical protein
MSGLDIFALVILMVLLAAGVGIWVSLGMMPGRIARARNHPQADAINICGWFGVITMGILCPLAFIWAYTNPRDVRETPDSPVSVNEVESEAEVES